MPKVQNRILAFFIKIFILESSILKGAILKPQIILFKVFYGEKSDCIVKFVE